MQHDYELLYQHVTSSTSVKFTELSVEQKKYLAKMKTAIGIKLGFTQTEEVVKHWYAILDGLKKEGFINESLLI